MAGNKVSYRIPKDKASFVFSFRHPVIKDAYGNGKKIQRGAGTSKEEEVILIVQQLQQLILEEKWHHVAMREEAMERFDRRVVDAFYDCMPNVIGMNHALDEIEMKTLDEGYPNIALVGMSGGGKTTLLRKLMGTTKDAFPTTSTNRTTTCNMEVIRSKAESYELVVQFISRNELESDLMDNMLDTIKYIIKARKTGEPVDDIEVLMTLLNHREMSTRLMYTLGMLEMTEVDEDIDDEDIDDEDIDDEDIVDEVDDFQGFPLDLDKQNRFLLSLRDRVVDIADQIQKAGLQEEALEEKIMDDEEVLDVIESIIMAIVEKFSLLQGGKKINPKSIWPDGWYFSTKHYDEFIKRAKVFVSDNYRVWGKILTPIVSAIRMKGPFIEDGEKKVFPAIITDGIGLGHTTNSTAIPVSVLARCQDADVIVFVDSAANPMMANTKDALKSLVEYGYADKLIFAFTKMDLVNGNNYRNLSDKKQHVFLTIKNYLHFLRTQEDEILSDSEVRSILENCIYFSKLNLRENTKITVTGLQEFRDKTNAIISKHISVDNVSFQYEALKFYYYMKESTLYFRKIWAEKTGYSCITNKTEHWTRIKALSRRLGILGQESYCELQPLSDFAAIVQENVNIFINQPKEIIPSQTTEEVADELKRLIKRSIGEGFRELNRRRMWTDNEPLKCWVAAYNEAGTGSRNRRARIIENIFDAAAPKLADIPNLTEDQTVYLEEVIRLVEDVLTKYECKLNRFNY